MTHKFIWTIKSSHQRYIYFFKMNSFSVSAQLYHITSWVSKYKLKLWYLKVCFTEMSNISDVMSSCLPSEPSWYFFCFILFFFFKVSLEDSLLTGRDAERFSLAVHEWGRQMEHARQWFVDLSRFMMGGSEAGCEQGGWGDSGRLEGQLSVQDSERLEASGFGEGEGVPAQRCCLNWLCFILARCSVYYCFVVCWGERPCLHIELHYISPRTQSCLSDCLIGICCNVSYTKTSCFISH